MTFTSQTIGRDGMVLTREAVLLTDGVGELKLSAQLKPMKRGTLNVSVKDRQGNESRIVRTFSVT
jgi:hypothetical protein